MTFQVTSKSEKAALDLLTRVHFVRRPHNSHTEEVFINREILPAIKDFPNGRDKIGNISCQVGDIEKYPILWSCHLDTCHDVGGVQGISITGKGLMCLTYPKRHQNGEKYPKEVIKRGLISNCLGADDGAGIALLLEMIKAKIPGLYVFHRGEERGCIGSRWMADKRKTLLTTMKYAIAFDRKGTSDLITFQRGERCCSEAFANSLADILGIGLKLDPTGMITDTAQYTGLISECTNISVGYDRNHGPGETLDIPYWLKLREAVLDASWHKLVAERKPGTVETRWKTYSSPVVVLDPKSDPNDSFYKKSPCHFWDDGLKRWIYSLSVASSSYNGGTGAIRSGDGFSGRTSTSVPQTSRSPAPDNGAASNSKGYQQSFGFPTYGGIYHDNEDDDGLPQSQDPVEAEAAKHERAVAEQKDMAALLASYPEVLARVLFHEGMDWATLATGVWEQTGRIPARKSKE